jgi:enoyl-CoA hydratase/carnithine racemase
MTAQESFARVVRDGAVLTVTINRPERSNALHSAAHFELSAIFDDFEADPTLRVAILTGEGSRAFCAGNDLKVRAAGGPMERPPTGFAGLTMRPHRTKPVIAAVNGVAFGGGFEIVLACDLAVAVPNAWFGLPEVRRGLVPLAGMHLLPRQLPMKPAMAVLLAGKNISADQALGFGLINEVTAEGGALEAAHAFAQRILRGSPQAIATCMDIVERSQRTPDVQEALTGNYASLDRLRSSEDFIEGPRAFAEQRPPNWMTTSGETK